MSVPVITIDGPSGSGKGTISHLLSERLGWNLLDSGSIYRLCALACLKQDIDLDDESAALVIAQALDIRFEVTKSSVRTLLNDEDVTSTIREETVGMAASKIAAYPSVRSALLSCQKAFVKTPGLVADGRDMGTVVFPDAALKFFLTASAQTRADRRVKQLSAQGVDADYDEVLAAIKLRDFQDENRKSAPLKPADDAILVDSSCIGIDDVLAVMLENVERVLTSK